ncbi:phage protein NinX family protein [Enterobacter cloacae]
MDYSQLSDLEINQRVSNAIHGRFIFYPEYVWDSEWEKTFDPCNKAADAWPIIKENNITLILQDGILPCAISGVNTGICFEIEFEHMSQGENPLRQAMIVFLMMQDTKHA